MKKSSHLLDVNVLLALAWPNHQFHSHAQAWFSKESKAGWATCAVTQLGFLRLSSNPAFTPLAVSPAEAVALLKVLCAHKHHAFLESGAPVKLTDLSTALGHKQITDAYLVSLASSCGHRLATFDRRLVGLGVDSVAVLPTA